MNILIIEDEILVQKSLARILEIRGCRVDCSASGHDALLKIKENSYDKIICDLMLQDITGFDVIEESKKYIGPKNISSIFVIITAYSSEHVIKKGQEYSCPIFQKPFHDLGDTIDKILTKEIS